MKRNCLLALGLVLFAAACGDNPGPTDTNTSPDLASSSVNGTIRINVLLKAPATQAQLAELGKYGSITDRIVELNAVQVRAARSALSAIRALPFVAAASPDRERKIPPHVSIPIDDFTGGLNTFNLDAIDVTNFGVNPARQVTQTGAGVYVAVLDTGLLDRWRYFFPIARIATQYARSFGGGGSETGNANISEQPNKWERDANGHGTHVSSIILGSLLGTVPLGGVAPQATVIPVKVLNQNGSGSSFVVAHGITYIGTLKAGPLRNSPVVINLSLGGPEMDAAETAAIDFAIAQGVIIVAAAGNSGLSGMDFPGAYPPVISAAAAGWKDQWKPCGGGGPPPFFNWWVACDVPDPTAGANFFIEDFSSRELAGQDLDVAAPGAWVLGPFAAGALGQLSFFWVAGTSQATPHVAGLAALLAQKKPSLTQAEAEQVLENTAVPIPPGSADVFNPITNAIETLDWGADATGAGLINATTALGAI